MFLSLQQVTCSLVLFVNFLDFGDGISHEKINHLKHELRKLEKYAEKVEHDIQTLYNDEISATDHRVHHHHRFKRKHQHNFPTLQTPVNLTNIASNKDFYRKNTKETTRKLKLQKEFSTVSHQADEKRTTVNVSDIYWPKFEDLLLASRKRYDWKSDRWIRMPLIQPNQSSQSKRYEEKANRIHKFNYKRVRLNNGKSKGNVVIAVTAVR